MISSDDIKKLAGLARIKLTSAEEQSLSGDMENILGYVKQIQEVSADHHKKNKQANQAVVNVFRSDDESHSAGVHTDDLLSAAPHRQDHYIKVKKIL